VRGLCDTKSRPLIAERYFQDKSRPLIAERYFQDKVSPHAPLGAQLRMKIRPPGSFMSQSAGTLRHKKPTADS